MVKRKQAEHANACWVALPDAGGEELTEVYLICSANNYSETQKSYCLDNIWIFSFGGEISDRTSPGVGWEGRRGT